MKTKDTWPKGVLKWEDGDTLFLSVPFTWLLPDAREEITQARLFGPSQIRVGGPAVALMPQYLQGLGAEVGGDIPGVLQRFNRLATRTTKGCLRRCSFCAVPKTEGEFLELDDWPDGPIICDNNILRSSDEHFDRVCSRLEKWGWADFNQGLDARLLRPDHVEQLQRIGKVQYRLALDHAGLKGEWERAFDMLRAAGVSKARIGSYALIGYNSDSSEAWERCNWLDSFGVLVYPMWFHALDAMKKNAISERQADLGWTDYEYRKIMQWFYQHKRAVK